MAVQNFEYTKVSELPVANTVNDTDILIINHDNVTSKIEFSALMEIIDSKVTHDLSAITEDLNELKGKVSSLTTIVNEQTQTINNIITAGFNLIGVDE